MNVFQNAGSSFKNRQVAALCIDAGRGSVALSDHQLHTMAPSIFAEGAHQSRTDRYTYIPTIQVVDALRGEGFFPVAASQGKSRVPGKAAFTKHLIRFRKIGDMEQGEAAESVLVNSHDGTSSYWMLGGIFRGVCKNGMIIADTTVKGVKVPHSGKILDRVVEGTYNVISESTKALTVARDWGRISLTGGEQIAFSRAVAALRFDTSKQDINPTRLLDVRREADQGNDLWRVFNRAQEGLIRGGQRYTTERYEASGRRHVRHLQARPVKAIDATVGLNTALWTLGEEMARLKSEAVAA